MIEKGEIIEMPDCELLSSCPFFKDMTNEKNELTVFHKDQYCHGSYNWCGRYMAFKRLEREMEIAKSAVAMVSHSNANEQS